MNLQTDSDLDLVTQVRAGNHVAAAALVRRHRPSTYRLALRLMGGMDAEDVVQESFLQAFRKLDQFKGQSSFSTWLYRVTVNTALMALRRRRRSEVPLPTGGAVEAANRVDETQRPADDVAIARELVGHVSRALRRLPRPNWRAFILRAVEDLDNEEAAARMGTTRTTVKTRYWRARHALREALDSVENAARRTV